MSVTMAANGVFISHRIRCDVNEVGEIVLLLLGSNQPGNQIVFFIPNYRLRYPFKAHPSCPLGPTWRNVTSHWNWLKHDECHGSYRAFWLHPHFPVNTVSAVDAAALEAVYSASWITQKPHSAKKEC